MALSQLCALVAVGILLVFIALFYSYLIPWGEDRIRETLHLASDVNLGDLNASYVAENSCSGCVFGSNTQWPTNTTGAQNFLDSSAGGTVTGVVATSLTAASVIGAGTMVWASVMPSAAAALSLTSGFYEMTHIVEQAQFVNMISHLRIEGAPTFLLQFSKELAWTNYNVIKGSSNSSRNGIGGSGDSRRLADSSGSTDAVVTAEETGPARYAALLDVDAENLFFYTLATFVVVIAILHVLYCILVLVLGLLEKNESFGAVARKWYRKVIWVGIFALLLAQYMLTMTGCFFVSEGGSDSRYILGVTVATIVMIIALGFGVIVVGYNKEELKDVGTYEHDQRPFSSKYSIYYGDYNFENRFFFVPRILLAVLSGAVVGVVRNPTTQLMCILSFTVAYLIVLLVRQPNLVRFQYYMDIASVFMKIVLICLTLIVARDNHFPQSVRDNVSYGIIGLNIFIFMLLFIRQIYSIVHKMIIRRQHLKGEDDTASLDTAEIILESSSSSPMRSYEQIEPTPVGAGSYEPKPRNIQPRRQELRQTQATASSSVDKGSQLSGDTNAEEAAQQAEKECSTSPVPTLESKSSRGAKTSKRNDPLNFIRSVRGVATNRASTQNQRQSRASRPTTSRQSTQQQRASTTPRSTTSRQSTNHQRPSTVPPTIARASSQQPRPSTVPPTIYRASTIPPPQKRASAQQPHPSSTPRARADSSRDRLNMADLGIANAHPVKGVATKPTRPVPHQPPAHAPLNIPQKCNFNASTWTTSTNAGMGQSYMNFTDSFVSDTSKLGMTITMFDRDSQATDNSEVGVHQKTNVKAMAAQDQPISRQRQASAEGRSPQRKNSKSSRGGEQVPSLREYPNSIRSTVPLSESTLMGNPIKARGLSRPSSARHIEAQPSYPTTAPGSTFADSGFSDYSSRFSLSVDERRGKVNDYASRSSISEPGRIYNNLNASAWTASSEVGLDQSYSADSDRMDTTLTMDETFSLAMGAAHNHHSQRGHNSEYGSYDNIEDVFKQRSKTVTSVGESDGGELNDENTYPSIRSAFDHRGSVDSYGYASTGFASSTMTFDDQSHAGDRQRTPSIRQSRVQQYLTQDRRTSSGATYLQQQRREGNNSSTQSFMSECSQDSLVDNQTLLTL